MYNMSNTNKDLIYKKYASIYKEADSLVDRYDRNDFIRKGIKNTQDLVRESLKTKDNDSLFVKGLKNTGKFITNDMLLEALNDANKAVSGIAKTPLYAVDYLRGETPNISFSNNVLSTLGGTLGTALNLIPAGIALRAGKSGLKAGARAAKYLPNSLGIKSLQKLKADKLADKKVLKALENKANITYRDIENLRYLPNKSKFINKLSPNDLAKYISKNHKAMSFNDIYNYATNKGSFLSNPLRKNKGNTIYHNYIKNKYLKNNIINSLRYKIHPWKHGYDKLFLADALLPIPNSVSEVINVPYSIADSTMKSLNDIPILNTNTISEDSLKDQISKYNISPNVISYLFNKNKNGKYEFNNYNLNKLSKLYYDNINDSYQKNGLSNPYSIDDIKLYLKKHFDEFNTSGTTRPYKTISNLLNNLLPNEIKDPSMDTYYNSKSNQEVKQHFNNLNKLLSSSYE